jgi:PHD/YefM family antitoxin component YafN of YafNO toxin-antitoxin module
MTNPQFVINDEGQRTAVLLDLETYIEMLEAVEELDDIRAYDAAKALQGDDELIPIEQAMAEFEERTATRKAS